MRALLIIFLPALLIACGPRKNTEKQVDSEHGRNLVRYAHHFEIFDYDTVQVIHIRNPENGEIEYRYFLSESENYKPGYEKLPNFLDKVAALSATQIGMLGKLDEEHIISAITDADYVYNALVREGVETDKVMELGDESAVSPERIINSEAQIVFYSGFGKAFPHADKLAKRDVLTIPVYDWKELHPLGKAEWILFFGYICGKAEEAKAYFEKTEREYQALLYKAREVEESPSVLSGNLYGDIWHCPGGKSYMAHLFHDAQLSYRYSNTSETGSVALSLENIFRENRDADFWFNPGVASKNALIMSNPRAEEFKAYQNDAVYCYSHNSAKYWELAAIEPQHVLYDYLMICHPGSVKDQSSYFYEKLSD